MGKYIGNSDDNVKVAEKEWDYFPWPRKVWKSWTMEGKQGIDTLIGGEKNDKIYGDAGNDFLSGKEGNDNIWGGLGNDYIDGGAGADGMYGWLGNDTYIVDNSDDHIIELDNAGIDTVRSFISYTLVANVENLFLLGSSNINGIGNELDNRIYGNSGRNYLQGAEGQDFLYGRGGADILIGGAGADYLDGGAQSDSMYGGIGNDVYVVESSGDTVWEFSASGGTDTVESYISYTLGDNVERLVLKGIALTGIGNELNNMLTGNAEANTLAGRLGNDIISGADGNDLLVGEGGNDALYGDRGSDTLLGGDGADTLTGGGTSVGEIDLLEGGNGADMFVIGDYYNLYYQGNGHAVIRDFSAGEGDKVQIYGEIADYTLDQSMNLGGTSALDTGIYRGNDLIAVVQDTTDFVASRDFVLSSPPIVD